MIFIISFLGYVLEYIFSVLSSGPLFIYPIILYYFVLQGRFLEASLVFFLLSCLDFLLNSNSLLSLFVFSIMFFGIALTGRLGLIPFGILGHWSVIGVFLSIQHCMMLHYDLSLQTTNLILWALNFLLNIFCIPIVFWGMAFIQQKELKSIVKR